MGIIKAFSGAISGTFADQWRDIISVNSFNESVAVMPGVRIDVNRGRGSNTEYSEGVISNGSKIYVPENTLAIVFDSSGIEGIITEPGGYEYHNGEKSVLAKDSIWSSIINAFNERFDYGGQPSSYKRIVFINLREIRNIKFGTHGPILYHDRFYETDLQVLAHGTFSIIITKPVVFIQNFLPANVDFYDFADKNANNQLQSELSESLIVALNGLSNNYRVSELAAHANEVSEAVKSGDAKAGTWEERFGFVLTEFAIRSVQLTPESNELVRQYASNKMNIAAYEGVSKKASDIAFKQSLGEGIKEHGLGDGAGMIMGMNLAQNNMPVVDANMTINEQIETVKKLKELVDIGALSESEFETKKKEILGL